MQGRAPALALAFMKQAVSLQPQEHSRASILVTGGSWLAPELMTILHAGDPYPSWSKN